MPRRVLALLCRFTTFTPSMITLRFEGWTSITRPFFPLSLPAITTTRSFFLTLISTFMSPVLVIGQRLPAEGQPALPMTSNYLGCEADDLHKSSLAQLTGDRSKNTRADRFIVGLYDHCSVLIEPDI